MWLWKRTLAARKAFMASRSPLPDTQFAHIVGARDDDLWLVAAIRRTIAERCGVPAELLYPTDELANLETMMGSYGLLGCIFLSDIMWCRWEPNMFYGGLVRVLKGHHVKIRRLSMSEAERELPVWASRDEGGYGNLGEWIIAAASVLKIQ